MDFPLPEITELSGPHWNGLQDGKLMFQRCSGCCHAWLPPRHACPSCLSAEWSWEAASGKGRVVSFVVFHTSHHEAFKDRVPYNVAVVELAEGPGLITNIIAPHATLRCDMPVILAVEREQGFALARFAPVAATAAVT